MLIPPAASACARFGGKLGRCLCVVLWMLYIVHNRVQSLSEGGSWIQLSVDRGAAWRERVSRTLSDGTNAPIACI